MGCGNPDLCIEVITTDQLTWGDVVSIKKTPDICVRRAANILNKHTILSDCSEPPDHIA